MPRTVRKLPKPRIPRRDVPVIVRLNRDELSLLFRVMEREGGCNRGQAFRRLLHLDATRQAEAKS